MGVAHAVLGEGEFSVHEEVHLLWRAFLLSKIEDFGQTTLLSSETFHFRETFLFPKNDQTRTKFGGLRDFTGEEHQKGQTPHCADYFWLCPGPVLYSKYVQDPHYTVSGT